MLSLSYTPPNYCAHCGGIASYLSSKNIPRCTQRANQCPAIIAKMQASREAKWSGDPGSKLAHMTAMSRRGNSSEVRKSAAYKQSVGAAISKTRIERGTAAGENNPNFEGKFTSQPEIRARMRKPKQDSSKMGRYTRTAAHRDKLSEQLTNMRTQQKFSSTTIEVITAKFLTSNNIKHVSQFLIQTKVYRDVDKLFYRHVYDFYLPDVNTVIEVDGEYWHGLPGAQQKDNKANYVAINSGYRVIRLSEKWVRELMTNIEHQLLLLSTIHTSDATLTVFGDFYNTFPAREL